MKEIELQKEIVKSVNKMGGFCWRANTGTFKLQGKGGKDRWFKAGFKGCSDIVGIWEGKFLAIEVKVGKKYKPTKEQLDFLYEVNRREGIGILAYSLDDVLDVL